MSIYTTNKILKEDPDDIVVNNQLHDYKEAIAVFSIIFNLVSKKEEWIIASNTPGNWQLFTENPSGNSDKDLYHILKNLVAIDYSSITHHDILKTLKSVGIVNNTMREDALLNGRTWEIDGNYYTSFWKMKSGIRKKWLSKLTEMFSKVGLDIKKMKFEFLGEEDKLYSYDEAFSNKSAKSAISKDQERELMKIQHLSPEAKKALIRFPFDKKNKLARQLGFITAAELTDFLKQGMDESTYKKMMVFKENLGGEEEYEDEDDRLNKKAEKYFSIGQGDDEESKNNYCWAWINGKLQYKKGGTHGSNFGHHITDRTYKGWYDTYTNTISFVFPDNDSDTKTIKDIPPEVLDALKKKFGKSSGIAVFEEGITNEMSDEQYEERSKKRREGLKKLTPLINLAKKYSTFEDLQRDWITKNFHGFYWHLTKDPNFKINPKQSPTDLSSLSSGGSKEPGLMVSTDINNWDATFEHTRPYVALIDLSDLTPNVDYRYVGRGFGHEIYVFKPEGAKVVKVLPIGKAKRISNELYRNKLPESAEELKIIFNLAHGIQEELIDNNDDLSVSDYFSNDIPYDVKPPIDMIGTH